jgi:ankyrin repeat protein
VIEVYADLLQIVLRVYKSVSEILTGFDVDAAGGAYDGRQVYVTPRALGSFITQVNRVDLTRRSPSYENRLSKYSHRGFEVHWPDLDRSRIDPTVFERSFQRTVGLARLLVLERLPTSSAREEYLNRRREERGRPRAHRNRHRHRLGGNIKDSYEDEIADWVAEEDVSNYHTFAVPYGQGFNARKIEKICYKRDLLLNAEWNQSSDHKVYLHRHPAFFGTVKDVIEDCCGSCPEPQTPEEVELARAEAQHFISGRMPFLMDDPGRQQIGSFNPLTDKDWTDMAYVSDTARLCQSIVKHNLDEVIAWLTQDGANPNDRDYTGRTLLHLAVMSSTVVIVKALIDHGARLTARLADGRTALHLAASRGNSEMIKAIMKKSIENEEIETERQDRQRKALQEELTSNQVGDPGTGRSVSEADLVSAERSETESEGELVTDDQSDTAAHSMATGSFVKLGNQKSEEDGAEMEERVDEPDFYNIDVLAWDVACSPLHLAIAEGHEDAVKVLCDVSIPSQIDHQETNVQN